MFESRLAAPGLTLLHSMLGQPVAGLYGATLRIQVGEEVFIYAQSFSLALPRNAGFLTIRTGAWFDTPIFGINCFELRVEAHQQPYSFEAHSATPPPGWLPPYQDVTLGHYVVPVTRIDVYAIERLKANSTVQEQVRFDHAIRFEREDRSQFCLVIAEESIAGDLMLYWERTTITRTLSQSRIRHTIE